MPRSAIPGLVTVRVNFTTTGGKAWEIVWHARTVDGSATTAAKMNGLAAAVDVAGWKGIVNTSVTYNGVSVDDQSPARLPTVVSAVNAGAGTLAGNALPDSSCVIVTEKAAIVGKFAIGRHYVSGQVQAGLTNGTNWTAGTVTAVKTQIDNARTNMAGAAPTNFTPVIYHRKTGIHGAPPTADTTDAITSSIGKTLLGTQRGRIRRRTKH